MSISQKQTMINACAAMGFALLVGAAPQVVEAMRPDWERSGRFLGLDKAGMEYFKLEIISTQSRRIGSVTLTSKRELETPYLGRRYTGGATSFSGEMTSGHAGELVGNYPPTTLRVFRQNGPHEGTLFIEVEKQGDEWIGNFFDVDGTTTDGLVLTQDYRLGGIGSSMGNITRVCRVGPPSESNYICIESHQPYDLLLTGQREPAVCHDRTFPGRYSHLSPESCEDELEDFYCNSEKKKPRYLYGISCEKPESD